MVRKAFVEDFCIYLKTELGRQPKEGRERRAHSVVRYEDARRWRCFLSSPAKNVGMHMDVREVSAQRPLLINPSDARAS